MLIAAILSPILGAVADAHASKRRWLAGTALPGALATSLMFFATPDKPWLLLGLFLTASLCFELSFGFYNGFLPEIADEKSMDRVSAWAAPVTSVVAWRTDCDPAVQFGTQIGLSGDPAATNASDWLTGVVGLFALPALLILRDKIPVASPRTVSPAARGYAEVGGTIRNVRATGYWRCSCWGSCLQRGVQTMISQASVSRHRSSADDMGNCPGR
jgi:UMF1 family MFS transporter